jgi:hypothetical protein
MNHFRSRLYSIILATLILVAMKPFFVSRVVLAQRPDTVDICEVVARPEQFNKKQIRVHARIETVVIEGGMWLVGDACPRELVALDVPEAIRRHPEQHPDYAALEDAILKKGNVGTSGKTITATFSGKFTYSHHKRPKRALILDGIENLETSGIGTQNKDDVVPTPTTH